MTKAEAEGIARLFLLDYPGGMELAYKFRKDTTELYGPRAVELPQDMKGGYLPKETTAANGRTYRGRVDVVLDNIENTRDLLITLRHEVLGHYGANTFHPTEKRALLDGVIAGRSEPTLKPAWDDINRRYASDSLSKRAEEVIAFLAEGISPVLHVGNDQVQQKGQQSFKETCIDRSRPMGKVDLQNILCMVAQGLQDRTRTQQTFPRINELLRRENLMEQKKPFHEVVAEKLIEQLKAGTAPWQKPWQPGEPNLLMPMNPTTGKRYKGINAIHLMAQDRDDSRWMTYKQAEAAGAQVRKGEKGTPVQYWKFSEEQDKLDEQGRPVRDTSGEKIKESVQLERPRVFFATVFNGEQIDGLPPHQIKPKAQQKWDAVEKVEHIMQASGAKITHATGDRAFYRPSTDSITLPEKSQFESADRYYATALHELGHWTGHSSRLGRDLDHPFGSEGYAKEELRAEISSMIIGDELGIGHDPAQHVAYVGSWIKALEEDPLTIFRAASDAEKIHDYLLAFEQKQVQEQEQGQLQQLTDEAVRDASQTVASQEVTMQAQPHELTLAQFTSRATVEESPDRAGVWTVQLGDYRAAVDAGTAGEAVTNAHRSAVHNAVYLNTPEGRSEGLPAVSFPPAEVLAEYPYLAEQFPNAVPELEQQAADRAEVWTLKHVECGTLGHALEGASLEQIDRALDVLDRMQPMNTQNEFWTRHELPYDLEPLEAKINAAIDHLVEERRPDAVVAATRLDLATGNTNSRERDRQAFHLAADDALGFTLPHDWTGEVMVVGVVERDGETRAADLATETPEAYHLYARKGEAQFGEDAFVYLTATRTLGEADELADRLALIDANSQTNEYEKATRLARVQEDRVRRDPNSTDEDISAAKEARKAMEAKAFVAAEEAKNAQQAGLAKFDEKVYINVPFKEKDEAKSLGARWDRKEQSWYVPAGVGIDTARFEKWAQGAATAAVEPQAAQQTTQGQKPAQARQYLAVPYAERGEAKAAGALWDKAAKSWYAGPRADMAKLERWNPDNVSAQQGPAMTPREEFAESMRSAGLFTGSNAQGDHPIMDGNRHRVPVEGGKKGALDGFYVGHLDGHPAGRIINNKTGTDITWKSKGYALSDHEKAKLQAEAVEKLAQRAAEQDKAQEATAQRVGRQMADLVPVEQPTPYLQAKGVDAHAGVFTDREGQKTYIPAFDADGKQWTMQYIQEDGTKRFAKDSRKEGCFHAIGGLDALAKAPAIVIGEGYATAGSLSQSLGFATVAAFDSGNLVHVAKALHAKFPNKPIIIAGDDDKHLESTHDINSGRSKAEEAAKAVGGKVLLPIFAPNEASYPKDLPPVTPHSYREHLSATKTLEDAQKEPTMPLTAERMSELKSAQLSAEQLAAINAMKRYTDFNDLATNSELGREGVRRQVNSIVEAVIEKHQMQVEKQEHVQQDRAHRSAKI